MRGFDHYYPGIYVPQNKTLTIKGTGKFNASSGGTGTSLPSARSDLQSDRIEYKHL